MRSSSHGIACAFILLLSLTAAAQSGTSSAATSIEQELIALDTKLHDAARKGDTSFVADFFADDYVQVTGTAVRSKADVLKGMATAKPTPPGPVEPNPTYSVRSHGDTAIVTHVTRMTDPHEPRPGVGVMHVFVKQQGRWKIAGSSSVPAAPSTELTINRAGYELMASGKTKEAIELFQLNVRLYPESWNVFDSLGEAYATVGEKALAIQNYEKSLQLNPNNDLGKEALAKLKAK